MSTSKGISLTRFVASGTRLSRKTTPAMSFLPSISAYTRSAEKPGLGISEQFNMGVQEAALTCKVRKLDQAKGIVYIPANLAPAECQLSLLRFFLSVHALLSREEKISACQEWQNACQLLTTKP